VLIAALGDRANRLNVGADGEGIVPTRLKLIIALFQKAPQGFLNQRSTEGWLYGQFAPLKAPFKLPLKLVCPHFALNPTLLPRLAQNTDVGSGFGEATGWHGGRRVKDEG